MPEAHLERYVHQGPAGSSPGGPERQGGRNPQPDSRSCYLDCPNEPRYPFGYGLSYTTFALTRPRLSAERMAPGETVTASVTLTNTGTVAGAQVVQLYIRDVVGSRVRPVKELKGFQKVFLQPGESRELSFPITEETLKFYTVENRWEAEPETFRVMLGSDSRVSEYMEFTLTK